VSAFPVNQSKKNHSPQDLIDLFNQTFENDYQTQLVLGGDEPLYLPANAPNEFHQIQFAHGYFSSALHEIAHWLIAGEQRRQLVDYGYWYEPDGRNEQQQMLFEKVEVKPQAIEWILSQACGYRFQLSIDNLDQPYWDTAPFRTAILNQIRIYCEHGLPERVARLRQSLCDFYQIPFELNLKDFAAY
jgi:elongation factor P hydroxylase